MTPPTIVFLGSFLHYSAYVLGGLLDNSRLKVTAVVTTPPHPQGRQKILTKNPVHQLAEQQTIPVFTPEKLDDQAIQDLLALLPSPPDLLVTAGYGKLLPVTWLDVPRIAALNLHFSLLPSYRGANPAEWAVLLGEKKSGVTVIEMSPEFDTGQMVSQASLTLTNTDTRETIYEKVYQLGAHILPPTIEKYVALQTATKPVPEIDDAITYFNPPLPQPPSPTLYARRLGREDGFVAWPAVQAALAGQKMAPTDLGPGLKEAAEWLWPQELIPAEYLVRASRALRGYPSLWTLAPTTKGEKRLKLLDLKLEKKSGTVAVKIETAQLEGQAAGNWNQLKTLLQI